jgi:iron complex outermembrane receptor protein
MESKEGSVLAEMRFAICLVGLLLGLASDTHAQAVAADRSQLPTLKQLTIEELLDVDVTLPLRRPERVADAPAAVTVLTSEDIRRSGATNLPEVLRFAPGLFTTRFNASSWIITSRGFAMNSANKLLVLIDGRSVYSPLFSGVFWEQQDTHLIDLSRIEIIRGPGAALWGSNALNGVIHVVSKTAAETQGGIVSAATGNEDRFYGAARYGGRIGDGHYRVYFMAFDRDDGRLSTGTPAGDGQRLGQGGFRMDFGTDASAFTLQGDGYLTRVGLLGRDDLEAGGGNLLGKWTRRFSRENQLQLQFYYDKTFRSVPLQFEEGRGTYDVDVQHRFTPAPRHNLSWGAGYRVSRDDTVPTPLLFFAPEDRSTDLFSAFVQDDMVVSSDITATIGSKFEVNDYTGLEVQPTVRLRWVIDSSTLLWGAISRAVRLPTRLDTDIRITSAGRVVIAGNPDFESEQVVAYEAGYRVLPASSVSLDIALFHQRYDDLRTQELGLPVLVGNGLNARTSGIELLGRVQPSEGVRFTGSYAYLKQRLTLDPDSRDITGGRTEAIDPAHQLLGQVRINLPRDIELDGMLRWTSELPAPGTPSYAEASVRLGWRISPRAEISLVGRDLLHDSHLEFASPTSSARTMLERAAIARMTFTF